MRQRCRGGEAVATGPIELIDVVEKPAFGGLTSGRVLLECCFLRAMAARGHAAVAELADAQASGACALRGVEVRLLSAASFGFPHRTVQLICHPPSTLSVCAVM